MPDQRIEKFHIRPENAQAKRARKVFGRNLYVQNRTVLEIGWCGCDLTLPFPSPTQNPVGTGKWRSNPPSIQRHGVKSCENRVVWFAKLTFPLGVCVCVWDCVHGECLFVCVCCFGLTARLSLLVRPQKPGTRQSFALVEFLNISVVLEETMVAMDRTDVCRRVCLPLIEPLYPLPGDGTATRTNLKTTVTFSGVLCIYRAANFH